MCRVNIICIRYIITAWMHHLEMGGTVCTSQATTPAITPVLSTLVSIQGLLLRENKVTGHNPRADGPWHGLDNVALERRCNIINIWHHVLPMDPLLASAAFYAVAAAVRTTWTTRALGSSFRTSSAREIHDVDVHRGNTAQHKLGCWRSSPKYVSTSIFQENSTVWENFQLELEPKQSKRVMFY